jgi:hypothetical protein
MFLVTEFLMYFATLQVRISGGKETEDWKRPCTSCGRFFETYIYLVQPQIVHDSPGILEEENGGT